MKQSKSLAYFAGFDMGVVGTPWMPGNVEDIDSGAAKSCPSQCDGPDADASSPAAEICTKFKRSAGWQGVGCLIQQFCHVLPKERLII